MQARKEVRAMVRVALSVAFLCASAMIAIPFLAVPFTLQSLAVSVILLLLGWRSGGAAILVYLALGAIGLPVFSGFTGGVGILFGQTAGFLFGFLLAVPVFALIRAVSRESRLFSVLALAGVLLTDYLVGALWYYFLFASGTSFFASLAVTVLPFLLPDAVKLALALLIAERMKRHTSFF